MNPMTIIMVFVWSAILLIPGVFIWRAVYSKKRAERIKAQKTLWFVIPTFALLAILVYFMVHWDFSF